MANFCYILHATLEFGCRVEPSSLRQHRIHTLTKKLCLLTIAGHHKYWHCSQLAGSVRTLLSLLTCRCLSPQSLSSPANYSVCLPFAADRYLETKEILLCIFSSPPLSDCLSVCLFPSVSFHDCLSLLCLILCFS